MNRDMYLLFVYPLSFFLPEVSDALILLLSRGFVL